MGIYYRATTVIGYEISISGFFQNKERPNCSHSPSEGKFCGECGIPVGTTTTRVAKDVWWYFSGEFQEKLPREYVTEHFYDYSGEKIWFGYGGHAADEAAKMLTIKSFEEIKREIAVLLHDYVLTGTLELPDTKFGIWIIHAGH